MWQNGGGEGKQIITYVQIQEEKKQVKLKITVFLENQHLKYCRPQLSFKVLMFSIKYISLIIDKDKKKTFRNNLAQLFPGYVWSEEISVGS